MAEPILRITAAQVDCAWHQPEANRQRLSKLLANVAGATDLILLPEMFTSGFTLFPESFDGEAESLRWMQEQANSLNAAIAGSLAFQIAEPSETLSTPNYVNRFIFVEPSGNHHYYDKVHLFKMGDEHKRYQAGGERKIIEYRGWRILLTVCYDLRFPVFCRNQNDYDLMCCVANWPSSRRLHWRSLLQARAIENQAYVAGVNRVGVDGKDLHYGGDSMVLDMKGEPLFDGGDGRESISTVALDYAALTRYREQFPAWQDADAFTLSL